jgi:hypothetical protein
LGKNKSRRSWPIRRALEILSGQLISNKQPAVIESVVDDENHEQFRLFLKSFVDTSPAINRIDVFNDRHEKLAEFALVPHCKRRFILGLASRHRLFAPLIQTLKWGSFAPCYFSELDTIYYFAEIGSHHLRERFGLENDLANMVAFSIKKNAAAEMILISNLRGTSGEEILKRFLLRWPHQEDLAESPGIYISNINVINNTINSEIPAMLKVFDRFSDISVGYLLDNVFCGPMEINDVNDLNRLCYELSGSVLVARDTLTIRLNRLANDGYQRFFAAAARQINRSDIHDLAGRKLLIL